MSFWGWLLNNQPPNLRSQPQPGGKHEPNQRRTHRHPPQTRHQLQPLQRQTHTRTTPRVPGCLVIWADYECEGCGITRSVNVARKVPLDDLIGPEV